MRASRAVADGGGSGGRSRRRLGVGAAKPAEIVRVRRGHYPPRQRGPQQAKARSRPRRNRDHRPRQEIRAEQFPP